MTTPTLTHHAMARARQRAIAPEVINWLLEYGREHHNGDGASLVYFDKVARRRLARRVDPARLRRRQHGLDTYAVVAADGSLITVGYRRRRIRHRGRR